MKNIYKIQKKFFSDISKNFLNKNNPIPHRSIKERITDYNPIYKNYSKEKIMTEASRCINCGTPWCHVKPHGCPLNNYIPEWNELIKENNWENAYHKLNETSNMSEFTGLVCPAPCEMSCTVALATDYPVTIRNIEYAIVDNAWETGLIKPVIPTHRTGKKIAIIGSGPTGLVAADLLNKKGHHITVFERDKHPGGLLMYGIPNMKLDKNIVKRRIKLLEDEGINFLVNTEVGKDNDINKLMDDYDAILVAIGSTQPSDISIKGRNLNGIHFAMDLLRNDTDIIMSDDDNKELCTKDKNVIIIGGGDTGTDCLASCVRNDSKSLVTFNRSSIPPKKRSRENPWPEFENIYKIDYGHEEAKFVYGKDPREYNILVKEFIGDSNNNVKYIKTVNIKNINDTIIEYPHTEKNWKSDMVFISIGYDGPENNLINKFNLETTSYKNIKVSNDYVTNNPKIFASGDCRMGQSLVVWAMREGRNVAEKIDEYVR